MAGASDYLENELLDHINAVGSWASPAGVWAALYTTAPTDAGGGVEVAGGAYARTAITFGAAAGGSQSNSVAVVFPTATADWGTVVAVGVFDAVAGNLMYWANLAASRTVLNTDVIQFSIGALVVTMD